jgi:L-ascorbate metabolism protein UlaG (beta-lactamase superfamily)
MRLTNVLASLFIGVLFFECASGNTGVASARNSDRSIQTATNSNRPVTIEYIAHACFRITSPSGTQILIDPYASRLWLGYDFPREVRADAVLISHPHYDHDGGEAFGLPVPWLPSTLVLRTPGTTQIHDITVVGYAGKHADPWGKEFGQTNTIWLLMVAGLRIVHLGDNGPLTDESVRELGRVDVLMIPIDSQSHIQAGSDRSHPSAALSSSADSHALPA